VLHIFDVSVMPKRAKKGTGLRDCAGWQDC
jgi:hypothetical protein